MKTIIRNLRIRKAMLDAYLAAQREDWRSYTRARSRAFYLQRDAQTERLNRIYRPWMGNV